MRSVRQLNIKKYRHRVALLPHIKFLRTVAGYDLDAGTLLLSRNTSGINGLLKPEMQLLPIVNVRVTFAGDIDARTRLTPIAWLSVNEFVALVEKKAVRTGRKVSLANAVRKLVHNNIAVNAVFVIKNNTIRRLTLTKAEKNQTIIVKKVYYSNGVAVFLA